MNFFHKYSAYNSRTIFLGFTKLESILEMILEDNFVNNAETLPHHTSKVCTAIPGLVRCNTYNSIVEKIESILNPARLEESIN